MLGEAEAALGVLLGGHDGAEVGHGFGKSAGLVSVGVYSGNSTFSIVVGVGNGRERPLGLFRGDRHDVIPLRVIRIRPRPLPIKLSIQRSHLSPPLLLQLDIFLGNLVGPALPSTKPAIPKLPLRKEPLVLDPQHSKPVLLAPPDLELLGKVPPDLSAVLVAAPVVVPRECADGHVILCDLLPVLPLDLGGKDRLARGDARQELRVGPGLTLGGREGGKAGLLDALGDGVGEVVALLGKLVDREGRVLRVCGVSVGCGSAMEEEINVEYKINK